MSEISEIEIKSMTKEQNYMRGYEDGKSDVLDKIRERIKEIKTDTMYKYVGDFRYGVDTVIEIIDKYKAEREG